MKKGFQYPGNQKVLQDNHISKIIHDSEKNIVIKTLKQSRVDVYGFELYQKLQQKTDHVVKVLDIIDTNTYTMEYIPGIIDDYDEYSKPHHLMNQDSVTKQEMIKLHKVMNLVWIHALELSSELPTDHFFVHSDFKLSNVVVIKNRTGIDFKIIDPDSWHCWRGYAGVDTFYQNQLKLALTLQRLTKSV